MLILGTLSSVCRADFDKCSLKYVRWSSIFALPASMAASVGSALGIGVVSSSCLLQGDTVSDVFRRLDNRGGGDISRFSVEGMFCWSVFCSNECTFVGRTLMELWRSPRVRGQDFGASTFPVSAFRFHSARSSFRLPPHLFLYQFVPLFVLSTLSNLAR